MISITAIAAASARKYMKSPSISSCKIGQRSTGNVRIKSETLVGHMINVLRQTIIQFFQERSNKATVHTSAALKDAFSTLPLVASFCSIS